jgi:TrmH family RNA methyltransferase
LLTRKGRAAASSFLVEGPHAVAMALDATDHQVRELFVTPAGAAHEVEIMRAAARAGVALRVVTDRVLASLGDTVTPQGVVAVTGMASAGLAETLANASRLVVVLDRVADPGNAGAVIRTADAAGADAVVVSSGSVDVWGGKSVRSTAGSILRLPVIAGIGVDDAIDATKAAGCVVLATAADGADSLDDLVDAGALAAPTAWVFGNEAHGLSAQARGCADRIVRLPIYGRAESLNLAAAAAVCLYASARAHRE